MKSEDCSDLAHQNGLALAPGSADIQELDDPAARSALASENRFRYLFESARDGILIVDADTGEIVDVNPFLVELLGSAREQFLEKKVWEIGPLEDFFADREKIVELRNAGYVRYANLPLRTADGYAVQVEFTSSAYLEGQKKVLHCNFRDNTELNQSKQNSYRGALLLAESQRLGHVGSWFMEIGGPVSWSEEMYRIYGVSPQTFTPSMESLSGLIHPDDRPGMDAWVAACVAGEAPGELEYRINRPDGTTRFLLGRGDLARDAGNKPIHMAGTAQDITERRLASSELERLRTAIEQAGEAVVITDLQGIMLYVNPAAEKATGYTREELLGKNPRIFQSGKHDQAFYRQMWGTISAGRIWKGRLINKRKNGTFVTKESTISPVRDAQGKIVNYVAINRDVTEELRLEGALRHSQKMESVGRLAGGVAHDFNNILTAINGYTRFAMAGLAEGDKTRGDLEEVLAAGERAARLTGQLLAFSRKQILNPQVLDINGTVSGITNMLERLIGEDIKFDTRLAAQPCLAKVDAGQLEQILLNLAVNARDAMPGGGTITLETNILSPDEAFLSKHPDVHRGPVVCLSVSDTGCGMTEELMTHLFEPFFTTKEKGKGTGLGLSMVYGIVKQSGGDIEVESAPHRGATFRIYFPQVEELTEDENTEGACVRGGNETVLLVEDETPIRGLGKRVLAAKGYAVLTAEDGRSALEVLERHGRPVDLLITDVVMPGMSGRDLARRIAEKNLARRTLFVSGSIEDHGVLEPGLAFLPKPYSPDSLLRKSREVLDGPADLAKA